MAFNFPLKNKLSIYNRAYTYIERMKPLRAYEKGRLFLYTVHNEYLNYSRTKIKWKVITLRLTSITLALLGIRDYDDELNDVDKMVGYMMKTWNFCYCAVYTKTGLNTTCGLVSSDYQITELPG